MTKREFVERYIIGRAANSDATSAEDDMSDALMMWDKIEKQVPRDPPKADPTLGGIFK